MTHASREASKEPSLSAKEKALVAVGAAIASGCRPCLTRTVELARRSGACERSIRLAIETALEARNRLVGTLAECADQLQGGSPEVDEGFRRERAGLVELIACGSALALRDAEGLPARLRGAREAGNNERMIASALAIARSIAETATGAAEGASANMVNDLAADPVPSCCNDERPSKRPAGGCSCGTTAGDVEPDQCGGESHRNDPVS